MDVIALGIAICKVIEKSIDAGMQAQADWTPEQRAEYWNRHFAALRVWDPFWAMFAEALAKLSQLPHADRTKATLTDYERRVAADAEPTK